MCWYTPLLGLTTLVPVLLFIRYAKLERRLVAKTTVWPVVITLPPPRFDDHRCFSDVPKLSSTRFFRQCVSFSILLVAS